MKFVNRVTVKIFFATFILFSVSLSGQLLASDSEAATTFQKALILAKKKSYRDAAKTFLNAKQLANSVTMKGKALKEAMLNFRRAKLYGEEFKCIEILLNSYSDQVNYSDMVDREYKLGNLFFAGHRDPAFWSFRWMPWLTAPDKTVKIYLKAIERAPFSPQAARVKLRLACLYIDDGKIDKSLILLRNIIKNHQNSELTKFAYLELANALFQLAEQGDGDGKYNREATQVLHGFNKKYPKATQRDWVEKTLLKTKDIEAQRLYALAKFYNRLGRTEPAERYLSDVLTKYPDTVAVDNAEEMLTSMDKEFVPTGFRPELKSRIQNFREIPLPNEDAPIMIPPQASGGKWLRPVRNLGIGSNNNDIKPLNKQSKE